jgi:hypothetical protein
MYAKQQDMLIDTTYSPETRLKLAHQLLSRMQMLLDPTTTSGGETYKKMETPPTKESLLHTPASRISKERGTPNLQEQMKLLEQEHQRSSSTERFQTPSTGYTQRVLPSAGELLNLKPEFDSKAATFLEKLKLLDLHIDWSRREIGDRQSGVKYGDLDEIAHGWIVPKSKKKRFIPPTLSALLSSPGDASPLKKSEADDTPKSSGSRSRVTRARLKAMNYD